MSWIAHTVPAAGAGTNPGLSFGVSSGRYSYGWQTSSGWASTCRQFSLQLNDGTSAATSGRRPQGPEPQECDGGPGVRRGVDG